tara:strand:+ start:17368 stop:17538 length:171 start_codon:yes stop_codon:yes gene_type:complete
MKKKKAKSKKSRARKQKRQRKVQQNLIEKKTIEVEYPTSLKDRLRSVISMDRTACA